MFIRHVCEDAPPTNNTLLEGAKACSLGKCGACRGWARAALDRRRPRRSR